MTAYDANNSVPMESLPTTVGVVQTFRADATNDGASTYSPDGLTEAPIFGLGGQPLQGGEIVDGGVATLVSFIGSLLNSGALCWVLLKCEGGAQQVAPATQGEQAVQLQQLQSAVAGVSSGRLLQTTIYTLNGGVLQSSVNGAAFANASSTFTPLSDTAAVDVEVLGGGGGGGGAAPTGAGQVAAGAGGAAGGWAKAWLPSGFSGVAITVGAGGAGATSTTDGATGGRSSFGTVVSATGGAGAPVGSAASQTTNSLAGGARGGVGSSPGINAVGGDGQAAFYATFPIGGKGGASMYGEGAFPVSLESSGLDAISFGSGGSGGVVPASIPTGADGGAGKAGLVIVREYS